jgi:hypothetical protein
MLAQLKMAFASIGVVALASGFLGCGGGSAHRGESGMPPRTIEEVLKAHTPELMSIPGVIGTAVAEDKGELCIKVLVVQQTPEVGRQIPSAIGGFRVIVQETGEIRALEGP